MTSDKRPAATLTVLPGGAVSSVVCLTIAGVGLGLHISLMRIGITGGVPFLAYVFWQTFGGAVLLLALSYLLRQPPRFAPRNLRAYAVVGFCSLVPFGVFALVSDKLPAGIVSLALSLAPSLTLLLALALRIERFNLWRLAGIFLGIGGILLVVLPLTSLPEPGMATWVLVSLVGALGIAGANISMLRLWPPGTTSLGFAAGIQTLAAAIILPVALGFHGLWAFNGPFDPSWLTPIASMVIVAVLWWLALEMTIISGPVFTSLFDNVATLAGVGWGILLLAERHSLWVWGALVLLVPGVYLVNRTTAAARW